MPAFRGDDTGAIYRACFQDGRPAPMHLPDAVVWCRDPQGQVLAARPSLRSGFLLCGCFYSCAEAAIIVAP